MKCKECIAAVKGFFKCKPDNYVCIGVKEPFVIDDIDVECTEYPEYRGESTAASVMCVLPIEEPKPAKAYVGDDGIYVPSSFDYRCHELLISKELFVEAYNKWIKGESVGLYDQDDADDWSED